MAEDWRALRRRITTGRPSRLAAALIAAPFAGGLAGLLFDAGVVVVLEPETLGNIARHHGTKPIWFGVLALVSAPAMIWLLLLTHIFLATLRRHSVWPYLAIVATAGFLFTWLLNRQWTLCTPALQSACVPPLEMTRIALNNMAMGMVPAIGGVLAFWLLLRPDRAATEPTP